MMTLAKCVTQVAENRCASNCGYRCGAGDAARAQFVPRLWLPAHTCLEQLVLFGFAGFRRG
jgi:hypothetical protein